MATAPAADIRVVDVPDRSRFEVRVDGEVAGFTEYRRCPGLIAFVHTLIDPRFEGRGLAWRAGIPLAGQLGAKDPPRRAAD